MIIIYPYITYEKTNEQKNQIKSSPCSSKIWRPIEEGKISQVVLAKPTVVLRALSLSISPGHNRPSSRPGSAPQLPAKPGQVTLFLQVLTGHFTHDLTNSHNT